MPVITSTNLRIRDDENNQEYKVVAVGINNYGDDFLIGYKIPLGKNSKIQQLSSEYYTVIGD